jgi:LysM repeat protein
LTLYWYCASIIANEPKEIKMKTYRPLMFILIVLLVISMTACERSASKPPSAKATKAPQEAAAPTDVLDALNMFATQTAISAGGGQPQPPAASAGEPTPQLPEATALPPVVIEPTAAPMIVVPTATPGLPGSYTLHNGEFPFCLARRFNVDPAELLSINGLGAHSVYSPGMSLRIPQSGHGFPGARALRNHPTTYTVKSGDTIYSIACLFGDVDPEAIAYANGLAAPYTLTSGQALNIP